jgi:sarcosine oxidase gamma subunit
VLELSELAATVVTCVAGPAAVDQVATTPGRVLRIAPDEAMIVREPGAAEASTAAALAAAARVDADALVLDTSDGWAIWALAGAEALNAFARLSQLSLAGEAPRRALAKGEVAQGEVAHVPAKVVVVGDEIRLLVPAMWRDAVRDRVLADCADLGTRETEPRGWESP